MIRIRRQRGYILLPVVILLVLVATAAFMLDYESALDSGVTASSLEARQAELVAQAGLEHALWAVQNSGCIGDMTMTTVPMGSNSYTATIDSAVTSTSSYTLSPDRDTFVRETNPDTNFGAEIGLVAGSQRRALMHYDLSSIAAGSRVVAATLWLYVTTNDPEDAISLHRVTEDWTEGDATWNTIASSFEPQVFGVIAPQPAINAWVPVNITALAQSWINDDASNHGLMLVSESATINSKFSSRDHGTAAQHPYLQLTTAVGPVSPVQISSTGTLTGSPGTGNDVKRTLTRAASPAYQPPGSLVLQPDAADGKDAWLTADKTTWNYGNFALLRARAGGGGHWRSSIQFALGGLPYGADIQQATMELYRISGTQDASGQLNIHAITRSWEEGNNSGGTGPGVTWDYRDTSLPWSTPGGDIELAPSASVTIDSSTDTWFSVDVTSLVQQWVSGSRVNNGMLLAPGDAVMRAEFASSDDSDPALRPKLTVRYACECGSPCLAPRGSGTVLMVVVNPTTLVPRDVWKKALFESWGYTVTVVGESANQATYDGALATADVVFISETVNANQVGTKLQGVAIAVVSQDGKYNDALGIASGSAWTVASAINLTDTSHYITALFPPGPLQIYAGAMEQLTVSGSAAPELQTLADTGGAGSLVLLDTGAIGTGGTPLAGRRVMLPLGRDASMDWNYLNATGRLLLFRALQWGLGADLAALPPKKLLFVSGGSLMVQFPSGDTLVTPTAQEQLRIDLIESWGYSVTLIHASQSQADFDAELVDSDVAYVTSAVTEADLGAKLKSAVIGVVNEQGALVDEFGFGQQSVGDKIRNQIDVIDNTHYITEPFATGLLTIVSADQTLHFMTSNEGPGFTALGQVFNTGSLWDDALGIIDSGGGLFGGGSAAGRRVLLPWGDASFDVATLNADGQAIMQRAIEWASAPLSAKLPVAHWKLDETSGIVAVDSAGGHDGDLKNGPAWMAGQLDGALDFDGNDDFINVTHNDALSLTSVMTLSAWVNAVSYGTGYQTIVAKDAGSANSNYWFGTWQNELVFGFFASGSFREVLTASLNLQPGTWYHLAASFDDASGDVRLYVDGVLVESGTLADSPGAVSADLTLGRSPLGEYWHGLLDDVRLYDSVLAPGEIADLLSPGGGGGSGPGTDPPPGNCDGTYRDAFEVYAFNNSDGSIDWSGSPWQEVGESDGPTAGDIRIWSDLDSIRIRTRDNDNGGEGLEREAYLGGATTATLSYDYRRDGLDNSNDYTTVEVSPNGAAGPWTELARYQGAADDPAYLQATHDISSFIGSNTRIRFRTSANMGNQDIVWFDNVEILCAP